MSKHIPQSVRLTPTSNKNAFVFRMILISFINIANAEGNITRKDQASCYKKYGVHRCSGNIGITICTTAILTKLYKNILRISMKYT